MAMDEDCSGTIPHSGIAAWLQSAGAGEQEVETILAGLDDEGLTYNDYLAAALCGGGVETREDTLLRTFARFDRRGCGLFSPEDVCNLLCDGDLHEALPRDCTAKIVEGPYLDPGGIRMSYEELCDSIRSDMPHRERGESEMTY